MDIDEHEMDEAFERINNLMDSLPNKNLEEFITNVRNHYKMIKLKVILYIMEHQRLNTSNGISMRDMVLSMEIDVSPHILRLVIDDLKDDGVLTTVGDVNPTESIVENLEAIVGKIEWVD